MARRERLHRRSHAGTTHRGIGHGRSPDDRTRHRRGTDRGTPHRRRTDDPTRDRRTGNVGTQTVAPATEGPATEAPSSRLPRPKARRHAPRPARPRTPGLSPCARRHAHPLVLLPWRRGRPRQVGCRAEDRRRLQRCARRYPDLARGGAVRRWPTTRSRQRSPSSNPPDIVGPVGYGGANAFGDQWLDLAPSSPSTVTTKASSRARPSTTSRSAIRRSGSRSRSIPRSSTTSAAFSRRSASTSLRTSTASSTSSTARRSTGTTTRCASWRSGSRSTRTSSAPTRPASTRRRSSSTASSHSATTCAASALPGAPDRCWRTDGTTVQIPPAWAAAWKSLLRRRSGRTTHRRRCASSRALDLEPGRRAFLQRARSPWP